jgi:hypothetical protein
MAEKPFPRCRSLGVRYSARNGTPVSQLSAIRSFGPQLFELPGSLLQALFVDCFYIKAPVAADLEAW